MKIADDVKHVFHDLRIDEQGPGTILRDFEALLEFFGSRTVETTGKRGALPVRILPELNRRLSRVTEGVSPRARLGGYPYIQGLYLLLRSTGFVRLEKAGSRLRFALVPEVLASWRGLNPTERYFALLEAWWFRARPEAIGVRPLLSSRLLSECIQLLYRISRQELRVDPGRPGAGVDTYLGSPYNVPLMVLFGFVDLVPPGSPGAGDGLHALRITPLGRALSVLMSEEGMPGIAVLRRQGDEDGQSETPLRQRLRPLLPEWRNDLALPTFGRAEGLFVFKVSLGRVWRRIAIPSTLSLDNLAHTILAAFEFDCDHLYRFEYTDPFGARVWVEHPWAAEECATDEAQVGALPLGEGATMTFVFDYGDNWTFDLVLERIGPPGPEVREPRVLEARGTPPPQYGDGDDEWE